MEPIDPGPIDPVDPVDPEPEPEQPDWQTDDSPFVSFLAKAVAF